MISNVLSFLKCVRNFFTFEMSRNDFKCCFSPPFFFLLHIIARLHYYRRAQFDFYIWKRCQKLLLLNFPEDISVDFTRNDVISYCFSANDDDETDENSSVHFSCEKENKKIG